MNLTNLRKLTHQEALKEVYKYTPQIRDYDKFMHIGARWLPYTMYFHEKDFTSQAVNTDSLGFRYSYLGGHRYSVANLPSNSIVNLIVGGSTALGVGATCDNATLASYLAESTGEVWINFSGRGYNATQELILFLLHQDKFLKIGRVVVLSGLNTLALEGMQNEYISDHGPYYYSYEFQHYMNKFNEDMMLKKNSFNSSSNTLIDKFKKKYLNPNKNPANIIIDDSEMPLEDRINRAAWATAKALIQWRLLLKHFDAKLDFVLQPLAYWCQKKLTNDEESVFHAIDCCPNNFYRLFSGILSNEVHLPFFKAILEKSDGINCYDMNILIRDAENFKKTIFVDRVHFNDIGNKELAAIIIKKVI
jgi:hypothetical protein